MMSRLRMQNLEIIGQGVPELQGVTDRQRNYFSNIDNQFTEQLKKEVALLDSKRFRY